MTEQPPSAEAQALAETIFKWQGYAFLDGRVAEAIDALIVQRVAAERERWQNRDRQRLEQIDRLQETVQQFQSASAEQVDYTEQALTVARDAIDGVPDHLLPYRINSEEIAQAIAPHIADALSERDAAAIRAFGKRMWSDTEEVAYQAGSTDEHAALLARLQEPDVFQAARVAAEVAWHDRNLDGCSHWEKMEASVRAVLSQIEDMLMNADEDMTTEPN